MEGRRRRRRHGSRCALAFSSRYSVAFIQCISTPCLISLPGRSWPIPIITTIIITIVLRDEQPTPPPPRLHNWGTPHPTECYAIVFTSLVCIFLYHRTLPPDFSCSSSLVSCAAGASSNKYRLCAACCPGPCCERWWHVKVQKIHKLHPKAAKPPVVIRVWLDTGTAMYTLPSPSTTMPIAFAAIGTLSI